MGSQVERYLSRGPDGSVIITEENDGWVFLRHGAERTETRITEDEAQSQYPELWRDLLRRERKHEAGTIDPQTAEVFWNYGESEGCVGRAYFARNPGSSIWVEFCDLPDDIRNKLWEQHRHELAFPAGFR